LVKGEIDDVTARGKRDCGSGGRSVLAPVVFWFSADAGEELTDLDVRDVGLGGDPQEAVVGETDRVLNSVDLMLLLRVQEGYGLAGRLQF
jgi:hypothetical protein